MYLVLFSTLYRGAALLCLLLLAGELRAETPKIAAASSLKFALEEVAQAYRRDRRGDLQLVFGSSGNFYRQIRQGAPFELFLSADEQYVLKLAEAGVTQNQGAVYASGRLVYFAPKGSPLKVDTGLDGLARALESGTLRRFAIANPDHAPYGRAAWQVLEAKGLLEPIRPYLIYGENVTQATQFAISGSTQGGLIAYSLALSPRIAARGAFQLVPDALHQPLRQRMVLLKDAGPGAQDFFLYMQSAAARTILARYGFMTPEDR